MTQSHNENIIEEQNKLEEDEIKGYVFKIDNKKLFEIEERLKEFIALLTLKINFWGYIFAKVHRKADLSLKSVMGVGPSRDGTIILYYNPILLDLTDDLSLLKVIEHEGMHLINKHIPRLIRIMAGEVVLERKRAKSEIWNIASDAAANMQMGMSRTINIGGKEIELVFPDTYNMPDDKASEWYYEYLMKNNTIEVPMQCPSCGGTGETSDKEGDQDGQDGDGDGKGKSQRCPDCGGNGNANGQGSGGIDDHSQWTGEGSEDPNALARKVEMNTTSMVRDAAKEIKSRGDLPSYISELIEEFLHPPQLPYHMMIRKLVRGSRLSKFKRAPTKLNRKRGYVFVIDDDDEDMKGRPKISPFPGRARDLSFDIGILIDTSGSMSKEELLEALSGVKNLIENDRHCKVTVIENDTEVKKEYEVKKLRDIQMEVLGRGGTTLGPGLRRMRELNPDVVLAFTDGGTENINAIPKKYMPKKKIIWVVSADGYTTTLDRTGYVVKLPK